MKKKALLRMTELKAYLLIWVVMILVMTGVFVGLKAIEADGTAYAVAMLLVGGAAADTSSRVGMHFAASRRRR